MGIRVECDWCREPIGAGRSYVTVEVAGTLDGRDVSGPARVFCGGNEEESCAGRLLGLLNGNPGGPVDMGMEWRLMPVAAPAPVRERPPLAPARRERRGQGNRTPEPAPVSAEADLDDLYATFAASARWALRRAFQRQEIADLDQLARMNDVELLALEGVAEVTRRRIRAFIAAREVARNAVPA